MRFSNQISSDYSYDILRYLNDSTEKNFHFLQDHNIAENLRAKMVDWMVEVLSSYKMSEDTFFKAVQYLDKFLKRCLKRQDSKDLHLIGLVCMFIAAKQEDIYPFRLSTISEKIARKKFTRIEILSKESEVIQTLNFDLETVTPYPIMKHLLCTNNLTQT